MIAPENTLHFLCTYEDIAQRLTQIDPVLYDKTRNHLDGAVTWLSPFITHGVISTQDVANAVLTRFPRKLCYRLLYELAWREYFHRVWQSHEDNIFSDMRSPSPSTQSRIPTAVLSASTGINAIDSALRNLTEYGFMHNHTRMWTAALCCNMGKTHWLPAATWMHYHLLDGDLASNTLSWQWIAGTFSHKRYIANQDNVNKYSRSNQHGTFLDVPYEQLAKFEQPPELADTAEPNLSQTLPGKCVTQITGLTGTVAVRSVWQLDAHWRCDADHHILFIDTDLHTRWPMSKNRWDFILHWASFIPNVHIVTGSVAQLHQALHNVKSVRQEYTACNQWFDATDSRAWLYPRPEKAFHSFSQFWKQVKSV